MSAAPVPKKTAQAKGPTVRAPKGKFYITTAINYTNGMCTCEKEEDEDEDKVMVVIHKEGEE